MADLIFLNGPPASGKSTVAQRFVDGKPFALNLDVDAIRRLIGGWAEDPVTAGQAARAFALDMAERHLGSGYDVIVPQFIGRPEFADQLSAVASQLGARFVELALWIERDEAIAAFAERRALSNESIHGDAALLVDRFPRSDPVGEMYDDFVHLVNSRPGIVRLAATRGDIDGTMQRLLEALG